MHNVKAIQKINEAELRLGVGSKSSWHNEYSDSAYVFIGGLDYNLSEGDILSVFSQYGEIVNVNLVRDKTSGKPKGFCFLAYEDQRSSVLAVDNLNGFKLCGRSLRVDHVRQYRRPKDEDGNEIVEKGCAPRTPTPSPSREPSPRPSPPLHSPPQLKKTKKMKKKLKDKKKKKKEKKKRAERYSRTPETSGSDEGDDAMRTSHRSKDSSARDRDEGYDGRDSASRSNRSPFNRDRSRSPGVGGSVSRLRRREGSPEQVSKSLRREGSPEQVSRSRRREGSPEQVSRSERGESYRGRSSHERTGEFDRRR